MKTHLSTGDGKTLCGRKAGFAIPGGTTIPEGTVCKTCTKVQESMEEKT